MFETLNQWGGGGVKYVSSLTRGARENHSFILRLHASFSFTRVGGYFALAIANTIEYDFSNG